MLAEISRSRGKGELMRYRWDLWLLCHDAVATPIPVASATASLMAILYWPGRMRC
jgi:hypothetical protein